MAHGMIEALILLLFDDYYRATGVLLLWNFDYISKLSIKYFKKYIISYLIY